MLLPKKSFPSSQTPHSAPSSPVEFVGASSAASCSCRELPPCPRKVPVHQLCMSLCVCSTLSFPAQFPARFSHDAHHSYVGLQNVVTAPDISSIGAANYKGSHQVEIGWQQPPAL